MFPLNIGVMEQAFPAFTISSKFGNTMHKSLKPLQLHTGKQELSSNWSDCRGRQGSLAGARRRCSLATARISVVVGILVLVTLLAGCGGDAGLALVDTPPVTPLSIPPLLEPTIEDGVSHYELTIGASQHDYQQAGMTNTYSYNGMSVLGPTLRLRTGDSVVIGVTNELNETTTTHWHGGDVPAEDDGGPHSLIEPGKTWVADFDVIQPAATLWYHPHVHGATAEHVYRGAAGLIIIEDDNPAAAALPATYGVDDIPVIIQDRGLHRRRPARLRHRRRRQRKPV